MKKKIVVHMLAVLAVLCLIVIDAQAKKPEITRYDAQYLDRQVSINLQWQSSEAIVSVRVAAGKEVKEVKIDPFDNKKTRSGYSGELNVVLQTEPVMYQESISYTIQVEDEDGQKSNLVNGKVAIPTGSFMTKQHDQWGKDNLAGTAKSGQKDMIEQLREVATALAAPPVLADIFVNNPGSCTVTFKTKATHSVGLKEIDFRVFDSSNKLFDSQQILATGKYWEGTSRDFTLGAGNYSVIAQAIDASGSTSPEKKVAFAIKAGCEPTQPQTQPQITDQQPPVAQPVVTSPQTTDQTQPPVTPPANPPVTPVVTPPTVQPPVTQPPTVTPPAQPLGSGMEVDTDRPGLDYRSFDLPAADPNLCQNACSTETNCKAFTYVRPGIQGPGARCWLKSSVPNPVKSNCCVSGLKTQSAIVAPVIPVIPPPPPITPPVTQQNLPTISEPVIYTNGNIAGVQNNPTRETTFTINATYRITFIYTYHYFNSGKLPGTIALRHSDGTVYGPWQAAGALGQGGVQNAYWFVRPNVEIKAGSYTVVDSDKATWSQNSGSSGAGFVEIRGTMTGSSQPPAIVIKPPQPSGSAVQLDNLTSLQIIRGVASQGSAAFKKNENLRTDLVMQTTSFDKTPYKMYEGVYNLVLKSPRKVLLSGNAQATEGWNVDNFILLEVFNYSGKLLKQVVIGYHEPVFAGNVPVEKLGDNKFSFAAGEIDISKILPVNEPFLLRASAVDYGGTGAASNVFLTMPPVTPPVTQQNLPTISEPVIYTNGNIAGVQNNPTRETTFTINATYRITFIYTYHYFNSGKLPGTIALRHSDGTVYGPWQAAGALGQGGVQNAYWFVRPNVEIKAGSYTVVDSDKATWSQNSGSSGAGFVEIRGTMTGSSQPPAIVIKPPQPSGSAVQLDNLTSLQIIRGVASQGSAAFKKNENLRTDLVMQTTSFDKTPYKMYEGVYNLVLKSPRKVLLSGNAQATEGWNVDNFILLEVFNYSGKLLKQVVIGYHEPVFAGNVPVEKLGDNKFSFAAGEIDISKILPVNEPFLLRASAVDYGGTGAASNVFLTMPPVTPPVTQQNLPTISEPVIYTNGNIAGVQNNPTRETTFTINATYRITFIYTYHYFNSGKLPGTIALRHSDGTVYGPWQAAGALGQGGVQNAYWFVRPNVEIKAGSYTVVDSDKATWSQNSGSSGAGFVEIRGTMTQPPIVIGQKELLTGTDIKGLQSWTIQRWMQPTNDRGEVTPDKDGIRFRNTNGNTRMGIMQTLNADVSGAQKLILTAVVKAVSQSLDGTGWQGREAPVAVMVTYTDVNGVVRNGLGSMANPVESQANRMFWHGFYYLNPTGNSQIWNGTKVSQGSWYTYEVDLMSLNPKPKTILAVGAEGGGWPTREGMISSISLKYYGPLPANK